MSLENYLEIESSPDRTKYIGFPPFDQLRSEAPFIIEVEILNDADMLEFSKIMGDSKIVERGVRSAKSIWYPKLERKERGSSNLYCWVEVD